MTGYNYLNFCGSGSESAGSLAINNQPVECPTCGNPISRNNVPESPDSTGHSLTGPDKDVVNFKGSNKENKKKSHVLAWLLGAAVLAAGTIGGLGYAHKAGLTSKLSEGKVKDVLNSVTGTCHKWCATVKGWANTVWEKISGIFSKKS